MPHRIPRVLGPHARFAVQRKLGSGEFADVFLATDRQTRARVALKLLKPSARRQRGVERLRREFQALLGVEHRNLARLHEFVVEGRECFFTMEYVEGADFVRWVRSDLARPTRRAAGRAAGPSFGDARGPEFQPCSADGLVRLRKAFPQLVAAVARLHEAGLVHGDVKPDNVLVAYGGRVVVLDYGLVTKFAPGPPEELDLRSGGTTPAGTPSYMAPESCGAELRLPPSDWYSVGLVLFESLTGALPFTGSAEDVIVRKRTVTAPRPSALAAGVPSDFDELCSRLLAQNPAERPSSDELARIAARGSSSQ